MRVGPTTFCVSTESSASYPRTTTWSSTRTLKPEEATDIVIAAAQRH
jgi:hypothetical protein